MKKIVLIDVCILILLIIVLVSYKTNFVKSNKKIAEPENAYLVLCAITPNTPIVGGSTGYIETKYNLYSDGTIITIEIDRVTRGEESEKSRKISNKKMVKVFEILDGDFKKYTEDIGIENDKTTQENEWKIVYYDKTGEVVHEYNGYIYGNKVLEELIDIIN